MKKAYRSSLPEVKKPISNMPLLSGGKDSYTENASRNAWNLQEMATDIEGHDSEEQQKALEEEWPSDVGPKNKDVSDLFVWLADQMDKSGETSLANFADFMIVKFAETNQIDHSVLFRDLLLHINEAHLPDSNQMLVRLAIVFSRAIKSGDLKNIKISDAKKNAYNQALSLAQKYLEQP